MGSNRERRDRGLRVRLFLAGGWLLWANPAAADAPDVLTRAVGCSEHDPVRLEELLAIEATTIATEHPARPSDVLLECRGHVVSVRVTERGGKAERSGLVDTGDADRAARTRLLSLTISELLGQLWSEAPAPPSNPPRPEQRPAPAPEVSAPRPHVDLVVGAAFRSMLAPRTGLFGVVLGADDWVTRWLALGLDVEVVFGKVRSSHADVGVTLGSTGLHAVVAHTMGRLTLGAGPGLRVGIAALAPTDVDAGAAGRDITGLWAGPYALASAQWSRKPVLLFARVEGGAVTWPFVGTLDGGSAELSVRGAWLAAHVGAGVSF